MPRGNTPLPDAEKRRIRALHKKGLGRNEIARQTGVSLATVTKVCHEAGLTFDRSATKAAVEARQTDLRARRQAIVQRLYARSERNLDRLESADGYSYRLVLAGGGDMGASAEVFTDDDPPSADERNHASSIQTYLTAAAKLEQIDASSNTAEVHSVLGTLADGFARAAAGYKPTADDLDP